MSGLTLAGMHTDRRTGVTSAVYFTDNCGTLRVWDTGGVWTATDEDDQAFPGIFATAAEALENAEAHSHFQYDD